MGTTRRAGRSGLALVALLLVLATACSEEPERADTESISADGDDGTAPVETEEAPPDEGAEEAPPEEEAPSEGDAEEAAPPGESLGSVTVPISFIDGGELEMAVTTLEVTGELMRVGITFTASLPIEAEDVAIGAVLEADENAPAAGISPEVIDPVNLKAYEAVAGQVPNGTAVDLQDGVPHTLVFYFAAPQDDVDAVDVVLSSQAPPITDVPFPQ